MLLVGKISSTWHDGPGFSDRVPTDSDECRSNDSRAHADKRTCRATIAAENLISGTLVKLAEFGTHLLNIV